jgi:hypothetical protein
VLDWQAAGPYQGIDEFVESIPFTETREYVEAIERNIETYKAIDAVAESEGESGGGTIGRLLSHAAGGESSSILPGLRFRLT